MLSEIARQLDSAEPDKFDKVRSPSAFLLERHPDFYSLEPLLLQDTRANIYRPTTFYAGSTIPSPLHGLISEIARIEKEWGLR
jgi:hypothetical protein